MLFIVSLIFLSIVKYSQSQDCVVNSITLEDAWDKVLHTDKMKTYISSEPPRNQSCVPVKVHFEFKTFDIEEYEGKFIAKVWARLTWSDERLTWSPESYGGVDKIVVRNTDIWVPFLNLLNSVEPDYVIFEYGDCLVSNDGEILCVLELVYESFCDAKLTNWPYDVQNCTLQFGNGYRFVTRFYFDENPISLFTESSGGWNIIWMNTKEDLASHIQLTLSLSFERQEYGLVIILVGPCVIISILTITSILLNVSDSIRLAFTCFSLISHFIFLIAIDEFLPKHNANTPVVLFFIRGSIILTITSVLVTYGLSKIVRRKSLPFQWVSSVSSKVYSSFVRYFVVPRWYVNSDCNDLNVNNKEVWTNFASILNTVYLFIVVIVYISMFIAYMPKHSTRRLMI